MMTPPPNTAPSGSMEMPGAGIMGAAQVKGKGAPPAGQPWSQGAPGPQGLFPPQGMTTSPPAEFQAKSKPDVSLDMMMGSAKAKSKAFNTSPDTRPPIAFADQALGMSQAKSKPPGPPGPPVMNASAPAPPPPPLPPPARGPPSSFSLMAPLLHKAGSAAKSPEDTHPFPPPAFQERGAAKSPAAQGVHAGFGRAAGEWENRSGSSSFLAQVQAQAEAKAKAAPPPPPQILPPPELATLQPSEWFRTKLQQWRADLQGWHLKLIDFKDPKKRPAGKTLGGRRKRAKTNNGKSVPKESPLPSDAKMAVDKVGSEDRGVSVAKEGLEAKENTDAKDGGVAMVVDQEGPDVKGELKTQDQAMSVDSKEENKDRKGDNEPKQQESKTDGEAEATGAGEVKGAAESKEESHGIEQLVKAESNDVQKEVDSNEDGKIKDAGEGKETGEAKEEVKAQEAGDTKEEVKEQETGEGKETGEAKEEVKAQEAGDIKEEAKEQETGEVKAESTTLDTTEEACQPKDEAKAADNGGVKEAEAKEKKEAMEEAAVERAGEAGEVKDDIGGSKELAAKEAPRGSQSLDNKADTSEKSEDKENSKMSSAQEDVDMDPLELLEEELLAEEAESDALTVENVMDLGDGEPLFSAFTWEDWALLALRFELHLLLHAFQRDAKRDAAAPGITPEQVGLCYHKYYGKELKPRNFGSAKMDDVFALIEDTIAIVQAPSKKEQREKGEIKATDGADSNSAKAGDEAVSSGTAAANTGNDAAGNGQKQSDDKPGGTAASGAADNIKSQNDQEAKSSSSTTGTGAGHAGTVVDAVGETPTQASMESQVAAEVHSNDIFLRLTEHSRRIRQRRLDAGDEGARLQFVRDVDSGTSLGIGMSSPSRPQMGLGAGLGRGLMQNLPLRHEGLDMPAAQPQQASMLAQHRLNDGLIKAATQLLAKGQMGGKGSLLGKADIGKGSFGKGDFGKGEKIQGQGMQAAQGKGLPSIPPIGQPQQAMQAMQAMMGKGLGKGMPANMPNPGMGNPMQAMMAFQQQMKGAW